MEGGAAASPAACEPLVAACYRVPVPSGTEVKGRRALGVCGLRRNLGSQTAPWIAGIPGPHSEAASGIERVLYGKPNLRVTRNPRAIRRRHARRGTCELKEAIQDVLQANRELARREAEDHEVLREAIAVGDRSFLFFERGLSPMSQGSRRWARGTEVRTGGQGRTIYYVLCGHLSPGSAGEVSGWPESSGSPSASRLAVSTADRGRASPPRTRRSGRAGTSSDLAATAALRIRARSPKRWLLTETRDSAPSACTWKDVDALLLGRRTYVVHAAAFEPMAPGDPFGDVMP
jgi:hypothetical protein